MKKGITLVLILLMSVVAYAKGDVVFAKKSSPIFLNSSDGQSIGIVQTATPMKVIKKNKDFLLVEVSGWSADGSPTVMFQKVGQRIIYAVLNDDATKHIKVVKTAMDDYETQWNDAAITVWIKKDNVTADINTLWSSASELFQSRCNSCHAAPKFDQFTANQWPGMIRSMKDRAGLMPDEVQLIVKYLQNHKN
ncbi:hypothetical protein [Sulfurospirillum sp. 1612]|uniref:hypothetical protein n=1 Tax=Sulfurospirillum sp. 1612 TaxID=3094835 RepID=UPI002F930163